MTEKTYRDTRGEDVIRTVRKYYIEYNKEFSKKETVGFLDFLNLIGDRHPQYRYVK